MAEVRRREDEGEADPGQVGARAVGAGRRPGSHGGVDGRGHGRARVHPGRGHEPRAGAGACLAHRGHRRDPRADRAGAGRERLRHPGHPWSLTTRVATATASTPPSSGSWTSSDPPFGGPSWGADEPGQRGPDRVAASCRGPAPRVESARRAREVPETHEEKLAYLRELREQAIHSASEEAVEKQHAKGKLTARERIEKLLDPGSFEELDTFVRHRTYEFEMQKQRPWGDAVVTGYGTIDGRTVFVFTPGLHRLRRLAGRGDGGEDVQGHGPRRQGRRAGDRASTTRAGRGSRRASSRSAPTATSSSATSSAPG